MAYQVIWSPHSIEDVSEIAKYLDREAPYYASSVLSEIVDLAESLAEFPHRGRIVPEFEIETMREIFCYSFRITYRLKGSAIEIVTVFHGRWLLRPSDVT
jgi:plasmid stabilization system protein ParE